MKPSSFLTPRVIGIFGMQPNGPVIWPESVIRFSHFTPRDRMRASYPFTGFDQAAIFSI
jgi:hypothetical protein